MSTDPNKTREQTELNSQKNKMKSLLDTIDPSRTYLLNGTDAPDQLKRCVSRKIYQTNGTTILTGLLTLLLTAGLIVLLFVFVYRSGRLPLPFSLIFQEDPISYIVYGLTGACLLIWLVCVIGMASATNEGRIKQTLHDYYVRRFDKLMTAYTRSLSKNAWRAAAKK